MFLLLVLQPGHHSISEMMRAENSETRLMNDEHREHLSLCQSGEEIAARTYIAAIKFNKTIFSSLEANNSNWCTSIYIPRATVRHIISGRCVINCSKIKLHLYLAARSPPRPPPPRAVSAERRKTSFSACYLACLEISARKWVSHACRRRKDGKKVYYHQPRIIYPRVRSPK